MCYRGVDPRDFLGITSLFSDLSGVYPWNFLVLRAFFGRLKNPPRGGPPGRGGKENRKYILE